MKDLTPIASLPVLSQGDLEQIIHDHKFFNWGRKGGRRAILKFMDLSNLDFSGQDLSYVDFTGSKLYGTNLSNGQFVGAIFFNCDLRGAIMDYADFSRADFRGAVVSGASVQGSDFENADLRKGQMLKFNDDGQIIQAASDQARSRGPSGVTVFSGSRMDRSNLSGIKAHGADFSDADLSGVSMAEADLTEVRFHGANLSDTDLTGAEVGQADFSQCIVNAQTLRTVALAEEQRKHIIDPAVTGETLAARGQNLEDLLTAHKKWVMSAGKNGEQMNLSGADMRGTPDLRKVPLTAVRAKETNFMGQDLHGANMQSAILDQSNFKDCKLTGADLRGSSLKQAQFTRADLRGLKAGPLRFDRPDGKGVKIHRANLSGGMFKYADLSGADLSYAILMGADLSGANLESCDLRHADLTGAILDGVELSTAVIEDTLLD